MAVATIGDVILQVRQTLQDMELDTPRYTDDRIIGAINLGILEMRRRRPDFFIGRYGSPTFQAALAADLFDLPEITFPIIVKYATAHVEMAEDEYTSDGRAAAMMAMFEDALSKA